MQEAEASHGVPAQAAAVQRQEAQNAADRRRAEAILNDGRVSARKVNDKVAEADEQVRKQVAEEAIDRNLVERDARNVGPDKPRRPGRSR
jgi:hypothetical protein